jgi:hypothetical protein
MLRASAAVLAGAAVSGRLPHRGMCGMTGNSPDNDRVTPQQITSWLSEWRHGDERARDRLFDAVHPQLHRIAARCLRPERGDHTLEPNALVLSVPLRPHPAR